VLPDEEAAHEDDRDDEGRDEDGGFPTLARSLGEAEDEEDKTSKEDEDTAEIHSLPLFCAGKVFCDCRGVGHEEPSESGEGTDDDRGESEVPSPAGEEEDTGENESERVCKGTGHAEKRELLGLFRRIGVHLDDHVDGARNREDREDRRDGAEDEEGVFIRHERDDEVEHGDADEADGVDSVRCIEIGHTSSEEHCRQPVFPFMHSRVAAKIIE